MKLVEGLVLLGAVVLFAWWQLRDVAQAQKQAAQRRADQSSTTAPKNSDGEDSV